MISKKSRVSGFFCFYALFIRHYAEKRKQYVSGITRFGLNIVQKFIALLN